MGIKLGDEVPSVYEQDTRLMLETFARDTKESIKNIGGKVDLFHMELSQLRVEVTNHLAHRLPPWVTIAIAVLAAVLSASVALKF